MKKLVVIVSLLFVSAYGFSQENTGKAATSVKTATTTIETSQNEISKDSTNTVAYASKRAVIESNFDKSSFLFRGRKSKRTQLC